MFSISDIQKGVKRPPRKAIIYGPPKLGKSTLAGSAKNALLIPTEDRVAHIDCAKTPVVSQYEELIEIFQFLTTKAGEQFQTVIIDSLDWLEPIIHDYLCRKNGYKSIDDDKNKETAFQKGLKYVAVGGWKKLLYNLDYLRSEYGKSIILVSHSHTITINPPEADSYDKNVMKIDKNALSVVEEWADIIGFYTKEIFVKKEEKSLNAKGKAISSNRRMLYMSGENPAMINGNSFGLTDVEVTLEHCTDIIEWILGKNDSGKNDSEEKETKKTNKKGE